MNMMLWLGKTVALTLILLPTVSFAQPVPAENDCVDLILDVPPLNDTECSDGSRDVVVNQKSFLELCGSDEATSCPFEYCFGNNSVTGGNVGVENKGTNDFFFRFFIAGNARAFEIFQEQICDEVGRCTNCSDGLAFVISGQQNLEIDVTDFLEPEDAGENGNSNLAVVLVPVLLVFSVLVAFMTFQGRHKLFQMREQRTSAQVKRSQFLVPSTQAPSSFLLTGASAHQLPSTFSAASKQSQFRFSKGSLRSDYMKFKTESDNLSKLGLVLQRSFSRPRFSTINSRSPTDVMFPRTVTPARPRFDSVAGHDEKVRYDRIKTLDIRFSDGFMRFSSMLKGNQITNRPDSEVDRMEAEAKRLITKICEILDSQVLTADEVEAMESGMQQINLGKRLIVKLARFIKPKEGPLPLFDYLFRLVRDLTKFFATDGRIELVGIRSLIMSLIYLRKIRMKVEHFTLTVYNVQPLFAVMMLLAAKFTEDIRIPNSYWSDSCNIPLEELNILEEEFCFSTDFDFGIETEELFEFYQEFDVDLTAFGVDAAELTEEGLAAPAVVVSGTTTSGTNF